MTQRDWVAKIQPRLAEELSDLTVEAGRTSSYTREVRDYEPPEGGKPLSLRGDETLEPFVIDLLVGESVSPAVWRPRVALEVKIGISLQDAVTPGKRFSTKPSRRICATASFSWAPPTSPAGCSFPKKAISTS